MARSPALGSGLQISILPGRVAPGCDVAPAKLKSVSLTPRPGGKLRRGGDSKGLRFQEELEFGSVQAMEVRIGGEGGGAVAGQQALELGDQGFDVGRGVGRAASWSSSSRAWAGAFCWMAWATRVNSWARVVWL